MRRILAALRGLGGRALAATLPTQAEYEKKLSDDKHLQNEISARLRSLEIDIQNQRHKKGGYSK